MVDLLLLLATGVLLLAYGLAQRARDLHAARRRETRVAALGIVYRVRSSVFRAGREMSRSRRHSDIAMALIVSMAEMQHEPGSPMVVLHRPHRPPVTGVDRAAPATGSSVGGGAAPTSAAPHIPTMTSREGNPHGIASAFDRATRPALCGGRAPRADARPDTAATAWLATQQECPGG